MDDRDSLILSPTRSLAQRLWRVVGRGAFFGLAAVPALAVVFVFGFVVREALPFFRERGVTELLTSTVWHPEEVPGRFGALAILYGTALVTAGAALVAVPLGVAGAMCLSDVLPERARRLVKPAVEMLAAIPSVAYGFFALVLFAPFLQRFGGVLAAGVIWVLGVPVVTVAAVVLGGRVSDRLGDRGGVFWSVAGGVGLVGAAGLVWAGRALSGVTVGSGMCALNAALILGVMALPTVMTVAEDALQAVGPDARAASYALGATRAETMLKVVLPAAASGVAGAALLGVMRALGETMVVWMVSGNASRIPQPWYSFFEPVRTITATIAGDMGEASRVPGSVRLHALFALALCLLSCSFGVNLAGEWVVRAQRRRHRQGGL